MKYRVEKIKEHTWLIEEYDDNASVYMYLLEGDREALLIDAGFGTIPLRAVCEKLTDRPVTVALTHGHTDHIGGTGAFDKVWLAEEDRELYRMHSRQEIRNIFTKEALYPVKEQLFYYTEGMEFELGGRTVEVVKTPGHSVGSVCFLDRENRLLFTGDTCCKAHVLLQMKYADTIEAYRDSIQRLLDRHKEYDVTWPGHHEKPVEKEILEEFLTAADGIIKGIMQGSEVELPMGKVRLLEYKDIGIEY